MIFGSRATKQRASESVGGFGKRRRMGKRTDGAKYIPYPAPFPIILILENGEEPPKK